jgi:large subunit ribosomal protein L5
MTNLKKFYQTTIIPKLQKEFSYNNIHQIPKLEKIVISSSYGLKALNTNFLKEAIHEYRLITGQHPILTKAKTSIASFKIRQGMPLGLVVTLRKEKMYDFVERLTKLVFPRIRDFRGISADSIDYSGNYTIGFNDQFIFPELDADFTNQQRGFNITFITTSKTKQEAYFLLKELGLPFDSNLKLN